MLLAAFMVSVNESKETHICVFGTVFLFIGFTCVQNGELDLRISTKGLMAKGVPAANVSTSRMICGEMTGYTDVQSCFQMDLACVHL